MATRPPFSPVQRALRPTDVSLPADPAEVRELISQLRETAAGATTAEEVRSVTSRIAQITRAYRIRTGVGLPTNPFEQAREVTPEFRDREHLRHLSEVVADAVRQVERGQNQFVAVSMPPRMGKSTLLSYHTPLWLLRRHPDWQIMTASYDGGLTTEWARSIRATIENRPNLGIALAPDGGAGGAWSTLEGGGMYATSVRGSLIGRGAKVMIIDDPVKDFVESHSAAYRQSLWDWWLTTAQSRLEPPHLVLVVMCMVGETPVLRPDGTETLLRDIRPGDEIATYENGALTTSRVVNWASQGPDTVYEIRTKSGAVVKANARHPFLTVDGEGNEAWLRTDQLGPGSKMLRAAGRGSVSSVRQSSATSQPSARGCAAAITTRPGGPRGTDLRPSTLSLEELRDFATGTGSSRRSMTLEFLSRTAGARSARRSRSIPEAPRTGPESSASTTSRARFEDSSATLATSLSGPESHPSSSELPRTTWSVTADEVLSVVEVGVEDVFDLQVERTENFIADGLVSHNTRWHEDDFIGRLMSTDHAGDPKDWTYVRLPALAEADDQIGRVEGTPLFSPLVEESTDQALVRWAGIRANVGTYNFSSMYQQRPAPARGAIFDSGWWRFWTRDESKVTEDGRVVHLDPGAHGTARWLDSWDCSFKASVTEAGGWVVGQRWMRSQANRYLLAQKRGRWSFTQTISQMQDWAIRDDELRSPWGRHVHERLIEDRANGSAIIDTLREHVSGLKPINPTVSKEARARAITPEIESGNVYLPHPGDPGNEWVTDLLSELRNFPNDAYDDQVDSLTQGLSGLRESGRGHVSVPRSPTAPGVPGWQRSRNVAAAALSDLHRNTRRR